MLQVFNLKKYFLIIPTCKNKRKILTTDAAKAGAVNIEIFKQYLDKPKISKQIGYPGYPIQVKSIWNAENSKLKKIFYFPLYQAQL